MIQSYAWYFSALLIVIALILALAWIARRLGVMGRLTTSGGKRRLAIVEVLPLDAKRRLVLVKRDDAEHLVLLGMNGDIVVESGSAVRAGGFTAALEETAR
ncbi:MAG TPA: flagellar biosynthetic protein FliO [Stellaceae bacterium]|nr:flagellar biosynthetic protein FliO [Stellaceae bacterium]